MTHNNKVFNNFDFRFAFFDPSSLSSTEIVALKTYATTMLIQKFHVFFLYTFACACIIRLQPMIATASEAPITNEIYGDTCNESICGSIVSKCLLTQSCKCDLKTNVTCYKDCFNCLNFLYHECCACVEMCPKPNHTNFASSVTSHVEELTEATPELFQVLTEDQDRLQRWISLTYPIDLNFINSLSPVSNHEVDASSTPLPLLPQINCTVAYMSQCMSWNKCKSSCLSMGANSYRWFHNGCCECVGNNCVNYGLNEAKCLHCPFNDALTASLYLKPNVTEIDLDSESTTQADPVSLPVT